MALTTQMRGLLKGIFNDKYKVGPFSGMIFNASLAYPDKSLEELFEQALTVQLKMEDLSL